MKRRQFITLIGGAAAWPIAARGQQPAMPTIGFLGAAAAADYSTDSLRAFRQGMSEAGFVEGRNVAVEFHWADGQYDRLPALAADLVRRQVAIIVASGDTAALAAKSATATIPIVFSAGNDPVSHGLVTSLNHPGGNLTGVTNLNVELTPKRLELLHELMPAARIMAALINPTASNAVTVGRNLQAGARALDVHLDVLYAGTVREIDSMFASFAQLQVGALLIGADSFYNGRSAQLGALSAQHAIPAIFQTREFAAAGGLMSYGGESNLRGVGNYVGRILKGERPADLPVQQGTKAELVLNLKTAKALGLTVPTALLARADEVIE